ncbi:AAA family ATPase [Marivirga sp. S37H4]|uniref:AAA family ATPase n=1 Tax=Marivirga aurantiaca TaxID=2802615 RepID=A0A935CD34_9BACT|nr:Wzz/FepE/Etk N-terminal domain-containing protein [Marivirga aurantiaca]MBK6266533.1 AAA family ATPase [Marivirga aurantiaca]
MDIIYLLRVLWRKKWIIILVPIVSIIAAFIFTQNLKPTYKASTQIATGFTTNEGVSITDEKFNLRGVDVKFSNLLTTMKSGTIINMVTYRMALNKLDSLNESEINELSKFTPQEIQQAKKLLKRKLAEQKTLSINDQHADLLRDILQSTDYTFGTFNSGFEINRVPNTDYIEVAFSSPNPQLSADAVNVYCEEFLRYYVSSKRESSSESVTFIKELVARKKEELDAKTEALQAFKANNNMVSSQPQGETKTSQVYDLEEQRDQINNTIYGLRLRIESLRNSLAERTGSGSKGVTSNQRIIDLKKKIDIMNDRFISSGTNDANLLDSLNLLRQQYRMELSMMEKGGNNIQATGMTTAQLNEAIKNAQIDMRVEESRLNRVNEKLASLRGNLSGYAKNEAILNTLERDVKVASDEYLSAVNKYNEAENKLLASSGTIRQVYRASPPASPEPSKRILIIALAGIATFGLTLFAIIVIEVADASIKTSDQYQRLVGLPLAGTLIKVDTRKLNFPALFSKKNENRDLELFKHFLRKIRFEVENSNAKTFLITSPKEGEGKTFITFALAYVLSLVKKKILIIDTNFKNNSLTKWLIVPKKNMKYLDQKSRGSGELKIFEREDEPEIKETKNTDSDFIVSTKYKNISIIGNSGGYESPEEIFHNKDFNKLIEGLAHNFDYILLEGPSLNEFSDSKELIKYVDKVIPVFSADSSIKQMDKDSIEFLQSLNGKLSGAILNMVNPKNLNV